jgi:hypothetical protein
MGRRVDKIEPYKCRYTVERSAYRLDNDNKIVHLRLLSDDNGKTHTEYYSYIIQRGIDVLTTEIENKLLRMMEANMDAALIDAWQKNGSKWALQKIETLKLQKMYGTSK